MVMDCFNCKDGGNGVQRYKNDNHLYCLIDNHTVPFYRELLPDCRCAGTNQLYEGIKELMRECPLKDEG